MLKGRLENAVGPVWPVTSVGKGSESVMELSQSVEHALLGQHCAVSGTKSELVMDDGVIGT